MANRSLAYVIGFSALLALLLTGCVGARGSGSNASPPPTTTARLAAARGSYPAPGVRTTPLTAALPLPLLARLDPPLAPAATMPDQVYIWHIEVVDSTGYAAPYSSLALDAAGFPYVSYSGAICNGPDCQYYLRYAYWEAGGWQITIVDSARYVGDTSLVLDSVGFPHIAYYNGTGPCYAYFDGTVWLTQTVTTGGGADLALDALDRPHIAYFRNGLNYASYDGATWQIETVDNGDGVGNYASLALDAAGFPHVSYMQYSFGGVGHLCYAHRDAQGWHREQLGLTGDGAGTSLALDAAGFPHISYQSANTNGWLDYTYFDGQSWHTEIVDDTPGDTGGSSALALDAAGRPHISYHVNGRLRYAYYDGAAWQLETADGANSVGLWGSLILDAANQPHVSYYDSARGNLKYAYRAPCVPPAAASSAGPAQLPLGITGLYSATYAPPSATLPLTYTWDNGAAGATAAYSWTTTGTHILALTATNPCGQARGALTVTVFCQPLAGVNVSGPLALGAGQEGAFKATPQPLTVSIPLTFTWDNGAGGPTAVYSWTQIGPHTLTVSATNVCGAPSGGVFVVRVLAEWPYRLYLPLVGR